jgi:hypothetical protein
MYDSVAVAAREGVLQGRKIFKNNPKIFKKQKKKKIKNFC